MVNAQEWLDENYPKEKRQEIERLVISYRNLEGNLNIENFPNLHTLDSNGNQLTSIDFDLESCKKIKTFGFR
jgi:Leucine-rich repeat (LRR) protein